MGNTSTVPINVIRPNRPPLSGQEGLQALNQAEYIDQYRTLVDQSSLNRIARSNQTYLPAVHSNRRVIPLADPYDPWPGGQVVWMQPSADGGLPHTRAPNYICLPLNFPQSQLESTLLHERVHVSQRLHKNAWEKIFLAWDMKPWMGDLPADIQSRRRINPDLLGASLFAWKGDFVPLGLFQNSSQPRLDSTDTVWWSISTRTLLREPPPGWSDFFGSGPGQEHPYELSAYLIQKGSDDTPAYQVLKSRVQDLPTSEV